MIFIASQSREPVLIYGETGTGKELVARCIHRIGPLRNRPFLPIDCCTLVPSLVEAELFGYVRGAFTGAVKTKIGLLEAAQGGTVFLDEIAEMPVDMQAKLLRALQEGALRRVGDTSWVEFDARIIAATNRELEPALQQGTFRKDLYYRLNVLTVDLPPLRRRKQDIPLLADHFLAKASKGDWRPRELSAEALECLLAYDWPGNVRELENCIRRAVASTSGPIMQLEDLPLNIQKCRQAVAVSPVPSEQMVSLREVERQAILRAIADSGGDKLLAARILGIGKTTIYRKLKEYAIG